MQYKILTTGHYTEVIGWLIENIGPLLWHRALVEWQGEGWSMHAHGMDIKIRIQLQVCRPNYIVRVSDEKNAIQCALKWG